MKLNEINPHIRYAKYHTNMLLSTEPSYCYDCRLFFIKQGSLHMDINGENYDFSNNTAIFLPPATTYCFHQTNDDDPLTLLVFNYDLVCDYSHLNDSLGTATPATADPARVISYPLPSEFSKVVAQPAPQVYELLKKCTDEFLYKNQYYRETASALLKCALLDLLREASVESKFKIITQVTEYIHTHYAEPELNNAGIAEHFNYHPYYLSQLVKQATGRTLHSYLNHYRIRIARDRLVTTDWDIGTIAWKCGFNSSAYFIKQFKQHIGITPKQYRKSNTNGMI